MADFLTTAAVVQKIDGIITGARKKLVLVSPYLQLSKTVVERLQDASRRKVMLVLVCREKDLKEEERETLLKLENLTLYFSENLHAKCYFNEKEMVITSMNLYEFSQQNREMGIFLTKREPAYKGAVAETKSIIAAAQEQTSSVRRDLGSAGTSKGVIEKRGRYRKAKKQSEGYCIRCAEVINHHPAYPLCPSCYARWVRYKDENYPEKHCHTCGRDEDTSFAKPRCYKCWKKAAA